MSDNWHNEPPPFNPDFRPGYGKALHSEHLVWCERNPDATREERATAFKDAAERLEAKFPPVGKQYRGQ